MSSYDYHQLLQYLYFEEYVDSYEEAEYIIEQLTDEEFEDLCEKAPRPTRLPKSRERNIGHDDWKDTDPDKRDWGERPLAGKKLRSRLISTVGTRRREDIETGVRTEGIKRKLAHSFPLKPTERRSVENIRRRLEDPNLIIPPEGERSPTRSARKEEPKPQKSKPKRRKTDLSKVIIAQYLYDEGYAESLQSAEIMSESISEQWISEILER